MILKTAKTAIFLLLLSAAIARAQSSDFEQNMMDGRDLMGASAEKQAIGKFDQAVKLEPGNLDAQLWLGAAHAAVGAHGPVMGRPAHFQAAYQAFQKAMAARPNDVKIRKALTYIYLQNDDYAAARKLLEESVASPRASADDYYILGYTDYVQARTAHEREKSCAKLAANIARADHGVSMLKKDLELQPDDTDAARYIFFLLQEKAAAVCSPAERARIKGEMEQWRAKAAELLEQEHAAMQKGSAQSATESNDDPRFGAYGPVVFVLRFLAPPMAPPPTTERALPAGVIGGVIGGEERRPRRE